MTRIFLTIGLCLMVCACASPALNMSDQQIANLSDDQLCIYQQNYRTEPRTEAEIERRGLNCNRFYRKCLKEGVEPYTQAMAFCMDVLRENERLRDQQRHDRIDVFDYPDQGRRLQFGF